MNAIRIKREQEGLTLTKAAELLGCDKATLSRIETGKLRPGQALTVALQRRFKLTDAELVAIFTDEAAP
jgi:transcriptional regulator with XRE-family HTH domain